MSYYKVLSITIIFFVVSCGVYISGGFDAGAAFLQSISPRFGNNSTTYSLSNGLVGHWTFDGRDTNWNTNTTTDVSGNGNTGTMISGVSTSTAPVVGKLGQAFSFSNNTTQQVNVGSAASLDNVTRKTICSWIFPKSYGISSTDSNIFSKDGLWAFFLGDDDAGIQALYYSNPFSGTSYTGHTAASTITLNTWQHVCVTYDNSSTANDALLYINGVSKAVTELFTPTGTASADAASDGIIGNYAPAYNGSFDGAIDDVRVYNRILTADEIKQLYLQGSTLEQSVSPRPNSNPSTYSLTNGLVGYWTFDGRDTNWNTNKTTDISGNGNIATIVNMSTGTAPVVGKIGQGFMFDATNDYVTAGSPASLDDIVNLTACAWIFPKSGGKFGGTFHTGEIVMKQASAILGGWFFEVNDKAPPIDVAFYRSFSSADGSWRTAANAALLNTWSHACVTYNNSSVANVPTIYVNGVSQALTTLNTPVGTRANDAAGDLQIGDEMAFDETFDGAIDDVRVYNRMLSADEIKQLYLQGSTLKQSVSPRPNSNSATYGITNGLVGYWTFDGRDTSWSANTTADVSGNGNTGTMTNMSTSSAPAPGRFGQGLLFDNNDDYVSTALTTHYTQTSISAWVFARSGGASGLARIVEKRTGGAQTFLFYYEDVNGDIAFNRQWTGGGSDGAGNAKWTTGTLPSYNTWHHVVLTYDESSASNVPAIYLDGVAQATFVVVAQPSGSVANNSDPYVIGNRGDSTRAFDGIIDDVRMYNRILTQSEIKQLYLMGR